jgi:aspartate racemase
MKMLGLIGGMSWESTALYYRAINQGVAQRLGGLHSARLVLHSVDFAGIAAQQAAGDWAGATAVLVQAARGLKAAGAEGLLIATNTMHLCAPDIEAATGLPLLHIADAAGSALQRAGAQRVALLGTRFTMEDPRIVQRRLQDRYALDLRVPGTEGRALLQRVIYEELCKGVVNDASRTEVVALIQALKSQGADAVILGCTEITMLIDARSSPLPVFDTTALHAQAAVEWMLS